MRVEGTVNSSKSLQSCTDKMLVAFHTPATKQISITENIDFEISETKPGDCLRDEGASLLIAGVWDQPEPSHASAKDY